MIGLSDRQSSGIPLPVLAWAAPGIFLEHARKMAGRGKAEIGADHGERFVRIAEEAFGLLRFSLFAASAASLDDAFPRCSRSTRSA